MVVCAMMCPIRTVITTILCVLFVTFRHVVMLHMKVTLCTWCSFHELVENSRSPCMGPVASVDWAVRYVLQLKYKRVVKVSSDSCCS